jgi:hypothetical protein
VKTEIPLPPPAAPAPALAPAGDPVPTPPLAPIPEPAPSPLDRASTLVAERPEVGVGAAFGGGFVLAMILKRLAR